MTPTTIAGPSGVPVPPGLVLAPFRALRYDEAVAGPLETLLSPPYDVIDDAGVTALERANPYNVVRVILPRGPESGPDNRYDVAARLLAEWRRAGALRPDPEPALYVYEMTDGGHVQRGLLGALALCDPDQGVILPHENVMAGPVSDRLLLTEATQTNTEPIFLIYDGGGFTSAVVSDVAAQPAIAEAVTDDGVAHRLWAVTDPDVLAGVAGDLLTRTAVIADGHHRYANFRQHQAARHASGDGAGPWDSGFTLLVDATAFGPQVHAIHRVMPSLTLAHAVQRAREVFEAAELDGDLAAALDSLAVAGKSGSAFVVSNGTRRWLLSGADRDALAGQIPPERSAQWRSLDVTVAHHVLIQQVWGLVDDEHTVGYRHDAPAAEAAAVEAGGTALLLNPTPVESLIAVATARERMPRKSTFFTPKPRTGLVMRSFADIDADDF
ncbi:MAG TPA: DUF1015 domain-containing protein [Mycobacteriales bacterium]|nr:DUF1015 domain-containing protein [Mycobacteriales bacterium]